MFNPRTSTATEAVNQSIPNQLAWMVFNSTGWNEDESDVEAVRRAAYYFQKEGGSIKSVFERDEACETVIKFA